MFRKACLVLILLLVTSACSFSLQKAPTATPVPPTSTLPNTATAGIPTDTLPAPAATATPVPPTPKAVSTSSSTKPGKTPKTITLKIFLIGLNDNGVSGKLVGCGDSAVPVNIEVHYTTGVLKAALTKLLSIKDQNYGQSGLYNVLYQSSLKIGSLSIKNGEATIHLTGKLSLGGECDNPRVQAELEETALQFSTVKKATIYINNVLLEKALSLK